jgi:membrane protein
MKIYWKAARQAVSEWFEDGAMGQSAAVAFYSIFALAPSIVLCVMVAGLVFGQDQARNELLYQTRNLVGERGVQAVSTIMDHADQPDTSRLSFVISIGVLLFSASIVFAQLQTAMNRIWNVVPRPGLGIWFKVKSRLFSMGLVVSLGFLLIVSLVISAVLAAIGQHLTGSGLGDSVLLKAIHFVVNAILMTLLFAALFKVVPDVKVQWREVWVGAIITALLFLLGQFAIGYYLGNSRVADAYGAAGSFIVLLLWMYYSGLILFYGAEFTQSYAMLTGNRLVPARNAMRLVVEARPPEDKEAEHKVADKTAAERRRGE